MTPPTGSPNTCSSAAMTAGASQYLRPTLPNLKIPRQTTRIAAHSITGYLHDPLISALESVWAGSALAPVCADPPRSTRLAVAGGHRHRILRAGTMQFRDSGSGTAG